jgi:ribosomal protein L29
MTPGLPNRVPNFEVQQAFADITNSLSSQLISASLAILALEAAFFTFIADKKAEGNLFNCFILGMIISSICFVISIFVGGKGINKLRDDLFFERITKGTASSFFNTQALLCILGLLFFAISFLISLNLPLQDDKTETKIDSLKTEIITIRSELNSRSLSYDAEINKLKKYVANLETRIKIVENKL